MWFGRTWGATLPGQRKWQRSAREPNVEVQICVNYTHVDDSAFQHYVSSRRATLQEPIQRQRKETKKRECAPGYVFWTLCGFKWVIWSQQTKGTQTGFASKTIATHLHQEEGVGSRESKYRWKLRTNHLPAGLYTEKEPEGGKWKKGGKVHNIGREK